MKTSNLTLALFSCALFSTAYVSTQMQEISQSPTQSINRTIASEVVKEVAIENVEDKSMYQSFKDTAANLMDDVVEVAKTTGDIIIGKKSIVSTSKIFYNSYSVIDTDIIEKYDKLQKRYSALEVEKEEILSQVKAGQEEVVKLQAELESNSELALKDKEALNKELEEQQKKVEELKEALAEFNNIKLTMDDLKNKIAQLELINEELTAKNAELEKENSELEGQKVELQTENERLACEVEQQEDLAEELKKITEENRKALERIAALEKEDNSDKDDNSDSDEADDNDDSDDSDEDKTSIASNDRQVERITSLLSMLLERQQEQQMMNQLRSMFQAQNRDSISSYTGLSGNYSNFFGRDLEMSYEINRMRKFDSLRFESGDMLNGSTYPTTGNGGFQNSAHNYNTREGSFSNRFIDNREMLYGPSQSYRVDQFDTLGSYNFNLNQQVAMPLNQAVSFSPAAQMQPSSISIN